MVKVKIGFLIIVCALFSLPTRAQNIAITDDDGYSADGSAMLDVKSLSKGLLIPRLTTLQRINISNPAEGLMVYDITLGSFCFYDGGNWVNLTHGNPNDIWDKLGSKVYLSDDALRVGIGTQNPIGKLEVKGDPSMNINDPLFEVINAAGDTVFAVYPEGVRIYVADDPAAKASGSRGGFAVGGFSVAKGITNEYLRVTPDSVRIYIDENGGQKASGSRGGFAVGGFSEVKALPTPYFNITGDTLGTIDPAEARILWYPTKEAFLSGMVLIESADSVGKNSMATGFESKSIGDYSQAFGYSARAFGRNSTAIGNKANAIGISSYAFGDSAQATGKGSYAIGTIARNGSGQPISSPTIASGNYSFAIGLGARAEALSSFALGNLSSASAFCAIALGYQSVASGEYSAAFGYQSNAIGSMSIAAGESCYATGQRSAAFGSNTVASGNYSTAMGALCDAIGYASLAVGESSGATGQASCAIGQMVSASDYFAFATGFQTEASNMATVAQGYLSTSSGIASVAMGWNSHASGDYSIAIGKDNNASGIGATALGFQTTAGADYTFAYGKGIGVSGTNSIAFALNDQTGTTVTANNVMAILGGNVGIDVVSPTYKLDVAGGLNLNNGISTGTAISVNGAAALYYNGTYFSYGAGGSANYFSDNVGIGTTTPATRLHIFSPNAGVVPLRVTKGGNSGTFVEFYAGLVTQNLIGDITFASGVVSYNAFTGSHYGQITQPAEVGMLLSLTGDNKYMGDMEEGEIIYGAEISSIPNSKDIIGCYFGKGSPNEGINPDLIMAVGNGQMWVVDNGTDLNIGDYLISSSTSGHAMKDVGEYEIANIIARVAEPVQWNSVEKYIDGKKHKLVSVFFENFQLHHNENKINDLENRIKNLEDLLKASSSSQE